MEFYTDIETGELRFRASVSNAHTVASALGSHSDLIEPITGVKGRYDRPKTYEDQPFTTIKQVIEIDMSVTELIKMIEGR